jgi:hypothetical protein
MHISPSESFCRRTSGMGSKPFLLCSCRPSALLAVTSHPCPFLRPVISVPASQSKTLVKPALASISVAAHCSFPRSCHVSMIHLFQLSLPPFVHHFRSCFPRHRRMSVLTQSLTPASPSVTQRYISPPLVPLVSRSLTNHVGPSASVAHLVEGPAPRQRISIAKLGCDFLG